MWRPGERFRGRGCRKKLETSEGKLIRVKSAMLRNVEKFSTAVESVTEYRHGLHGYRLSMQ
jgi:hypothetical protein